MINITVKDPKKMITQIVVLHESEDMVGIYFNLTRVGKRAEHVGGGDGWNDIYVMDDNIDPKDWPSASFKVDNLPFAGDHSMLSTSGRYEIFFFFIAHKSILDGRVVHDGPETHESEGPKA